MLQNSPESFEKNLIEGHLNELRVALHYMSEGYHVRIGFNRAHFDITLLNENGGSISRVEVKWDKRAETTRHLFFEVENARQNLPSGIMATEANTWCHVTGKGSRALLVSVDVLRSFLRSKRFRSAPTGGTDSNSRGLLVPEHSIPKSEAFRWITLPTPEDYFKAMFSQGRAATSGVRKR